MNSDKTDQAETTNEQEPRLEISLREVPSKLQISGGREVPFTRAMLSMGNTGRMGLAGFIPHATLAQEGGIVYDVTDALSRSWKGDSLQPGETVAWDVYDLLLTEHAGVASKVHLWGYKAVVNWWFDLAVWADYRPSDSETPRSTPVYRWKLRWNPAGTAADEINLSVEVVK